MLQLTDVRSRIGAVLKPKLVPPPTSDRILAPDFHADDLRPEPFYVARLDMMGARAAMTRSIQASAAFIGKLHVAMLEAPRDELVAMVPTIDGAYVVCKTSHGAAAVYATSPPLTSNAFYRRNRSV